MDTPLRTRNRLGLQSPPYTRTRSPPGHLPTKGVAFESSLLDIYSLDMVLLCIRWFGLVKAGLE